MNEHRASAQSQLLLQGGEYGRLRAYYLVHLRGPSVGHVLQQLVLKLTSLNLHRKTRCYSWTQT